VFKQRLQILVLCFLLGHAVLAARLFQLQILKGSYYTQKARDKVLKVERLEASRGGIYDRNGQPLALDRPVFDLEVSLPVTPSPERLLDNLLTALRQSDPHLALETLQAALGKAWEEGERDIERKRREYQEKGKLLHPREERQLRMVRRPLLGDIGRNAAFLILTNPQSYPGVHVTARSKRIYPQGKTAAHLIGYLTGLFPEDVARLREEERYLDDLLNRYGENYVYTEESWLQEGYFLNDRTGRQGLERILEDRLRGRRGSRLVERTFSAPPAPGDEQVLEELSIPPQPGRDVHLTLDARLQRACEEILAQPVEGQGRVTGAAVVLEAATGRILAAASNPGFDPNESLEPLLDDPHKPMLNRALAGLYPLGSVFKPVTALAGFDAGVLTSETTIVCERNYTVGPITFRCNTAHGPYQLEEALEESCNVFFFEIAQRLWKQRRRSGPSLSAWAELFGFGRVPGTEMQSEERPGELPPETAPADLINFSIGQGKLLVTPLQAARYMAAIARGGNLPRPTFLQDEPPPPGEPMPIPPDRLRQIQQGLRRVVTHGTAKDKGLAPFNAAGKTGTAEVGERQVPHAWFVGYAPFHQPRVVVAVVLGHGGWGGKAAAPVAAQILEHYFKLYG
jgi:penicillin-binding protein 2